MDRQADKAIALPPSLMRSVTTVNKLRGSDSSVDDAQVAEKSQTDKRRIAEMYLNVVRHLVDRLKYPQLRHVHRTDVKINVRVTAKQTHTHTHTHTHIYITKVLKTFLLFYF